MRWLVTGGLGFIGARFVRLALQAHPALEIVNLDAVTYAASEERLEEIADDRRHRLVRGSICDADAVAHAIGAGVDAAINFAAETHVDRSIEEPESFVKTDVLGTHVLLEAARHGRIARFLQVSTDEVYGNVAQGVSSETDPLRPRSPYSASKAGGDLLASAYASTYGVSVLITRGSNTYGPYQYPEKLVPLFITNLLDDRPVPMYGDGLQVRDWLHVDDHARGVLHVLEHGETGGVYNLGGGNERTNLEITRMLLDACSRQFDSHVDYVTDRLGHDRRYALDCRRAAALGWRPQVPFDDGLCATVAWYRGHASWWRRYRRGGAWVRS